MLGLRCFARVLFSRGEWELLLIGGRRLIVVLLLSQSTGSRCSGFSGVARGLSSCGPWAELLCGKWDLPGPEIEAVSPALVGRFPSTSPPGKSYIILFNG